MKKLNLIIILCAITFVASAQRNDTLVRSIQIERDYVPEIAPATRPDVSLTITEPTIARSNTTFSRTSIPFDVERGEFIPISPQNMTFINREKSKPGFLRIGAGPLFTWLADLWYPVWDTKDGYFDIAIHHDGIYGISQKSMPNKKLFNTGLGINFKKNFGIHQFYLGAKYDNETFNYYGNDTTISKHYSPEQTAYMDSISKINQPFHKADFKLGFRSNKRTGSGWLYDTYISYHLFSSKIPFAPAAMESNINEHNINAAVRTDILINEKHHIDVEFGAKTYFYGKQQTLWEPNTIIRLLPAYLINTKKINLRLGVKTFFNFNKGSIIVFSPDVKFDYFFKDFLNLYVGITGDYKVNSLANITDDNRYYQLNQPSTQNTFTPVDIFGGFKVKVAKGFLFDAFVSYKLVNNKIFYTNTLLVSRASFDDTGTHLYSKTFFPINGTGWKLTAGLRASYNIKERANIFAQVEFNGWSLHNKELIMFGTTTKINEKVVLHAPVEANVGSEFKIGKKFFGSVNLYIASGFDAIRNVSDVVDAEGNTTQHLDIVTLPPTFDLNLGFGYNMKKNISLFAQANNVLALSPKLNYQEWYGYSSMGAHLLLGATINF